ncbi:LytTR family DNA-binding domain-containing protein [Pelotomaculum isophthalicicum JI]|uniref:Stage 0 sporulation protein A homolog n=1 Tax=Pelotomaculum isophthalicicum JI TaxID=947010 RepID=A0A9X4JT40_9FIRM|nr:LytTR family DNA-binding domain-containing protein [Pelotomaculum isophthalicicum]MDF9408094.1 LytTR family DNA-binding domain-containing protein [Pelotomaculum isophthalicicum JI]
MGEPELKVVIAEDDEPICNLLKNYLSSFEEVAVVGTAADGEKLIEVVKATSPDAVFVDIQMPGIDGLSAVHQLQNEFTSLFAVFVSAHTHYAVDAFNMDAADFLAKPFTRERVGKALQKLKRFKKMIDKTRNNNTSATNMAETDNSNQIMLKCGHGIVLVEKENIIFVEKLGKKSIVHTTRGSFETAHSLVTFEKSLNKPNFFRCHKSFIINVKLVEKISPYADRAYEISFYNYNQTVTMRREKFEEFCSLFNGNTL